MAKFHAYRDIKLCSKDCLCLFVCPTGASDTETGQVDFSKCIGCGACANACPSHAITLIPNKMPKQQVKQEEVVKALFKVANTKIDAINKLKAMIKSSSNEEEKRLYKALIHANKVIVEDLMREAGYMLPESKNTHEFLEELKKTTPQQENTIKQLLNKLEVNE